MPKYDLNRFKEAQKKDYLRAKQELSASQKKSHWIWYIFPQLQGLGQSSKCKEYGLKGGGEACAYLQDTILLERYTTLLTIVSHQLVSGVSLVNLFNGKIDAFKFTSSITLFNLAAKHLINTNNNSQKLVDFIKLSNRIINKINQQDYTPCQYTIHNLTFSKTSNKEPEHKQISINGSYHSTQDLSLPIGNVNILSQVKIRNSSYLSLALEHPILLSAGIGLLVAAAVIVTVITLGASAAISGTTTTLATLAVGCGLFAGVTTFIGLENSSNSKFGAD